MSDSDADLLVVASNPPQLAGLRTGLSESLNGEIAGVRVQTKAIGFGPTNAAAAATRGLISVKPRAVIFIGDCVAYEELDTENAALVVQRVILVDSAKLRREAYFPEPMQTSIECDPVLAAALADSVAAKRVVTIASSLGRTSSAELGRAILTSTGAVAELPELFGAAQAAAALQVPFGAVVGVSSLVGVDSDPHRRREGERAAVTSAADALSAWLNRGARGLR